MIDCRLKAYFLGCIAVKNTIGEYFEIVTINVRHQIFNGKMKDAKSLQHILKEIESDLNGSPMPTLIFDRGVVSEDNMNLLQDYKYIFACRPNEEIAFIDDFKNEKFTILKGREKARKTKVEILLKEKDDEVFLLCKSEGRKSKESAMRNNREKKLEVELENLLKQIRKGKANNPVKIQRRIGRLKESHSQVAKYYEIDYYHKEFSYSIPTDEKIPKQLLKSLKILQEKSDENKITYPALKKKLAERKEKYSTDFLKIEIHLKESELIWHTIDEIEEKERCMDGNYLLKTNRTDLEESEIWNLYIMLTRVENAFRDLKSYLGLRPNYHQLMHRVDGHVFISILTYHLLHSIEYTLRQCDDHSRWSTIKRLVSTHNYSTTQLLTVAGGVINVRKSGIPEAIQEDIYQKLGVNYKNLPVMKTYV